MEYITIPRLVHHPLNPRKELGDLEELTKSIKTQGILQPLTVIPGRDVEGVDNDRYVVLIGNRRLEAAKAAEEVTLPCIIKEGLSEREQMAIMLEENMQRSDLTIVEEAKGFQMMLDFGATVDDITEKTGFSKSTVYHRLNLAKLDEDALQAAVDSQITLTQLAKLEEIDDIEERNRILKKPSEISWRVDQYKEEQRLKNLYDEWFHQMNELYLIELLPKEIKDGYRRSLIYSTDKRHLEVKDDLPKQTLYVEVTTYGWVYLYTFEEITQTEKMPSKLDSLKEERNEIYREIENNYSNAIQSVKNRLMDMVKKEAPYVANREKVFRNTMYIFSHYDMSPIDYLQEFHGDCYPGVEEDEDCDKKYEKFVESLDPSLAAVAAITYALERFCVPSCTWRGQYEYYESRLDERENIMIALLRAIDSLMEIFSGDKMPKETEDIILGHDERTEDYYELINEIKKLEEEEDD